MFDKNEIIRDKQISGMWNMIMVISYGLIFFSMMFALGDKHHTFARIVFWIGIVSVWIAIFGKVKHERKKLK